MHDSIEFDSQGNLILKLNWKHILKVVIILGLIVGGYYLPLEGITPASRISLMIFIGAAGFWVTEAISPFATAIMVIVLNIYFLGTPGGPLGLTGVGADSYQVFLNPMASPILALFFGGFILSIAATKHGLDIRLAKAFIKPFGTKPSMVLLGIILTTALFSMFMSNTATTTMMIAILHPLLIHFEGRTPFKRAMVLAVPFAANIGGIGTIIGTPPNAVAASVLGGIGHPISFVKWMIIGVPVAVVMLFILWVILVLVFKPNKEEFEILFPDTMNMTWDLLVVLITFTVTVTMWLTEPVHHIPAAVTALLPVMVFTMFKIIDREDLKKIDWDVLILVAGGMTLGLSMTKTGLSQLLVAQISVLQLSPIMFLLLFAFVAIIISNFMSNTSAANLMIPIITSFAMISPEYGAVMIAFSCSLAMSLPISTPPNAIAFATREIDTREMAKYGSIISLIGLIVVIIVLYFFHNVLNYI